MRIQAAFFSCASLLLLPACDGALGGNIHDEPTEFNAASLEEEPPLRAVRGERPEPVEAPDDPADDPSAGTESTEPEDAGTEVTTPDPPPRTPSGGSGRPPRGGGKGNHSGAVVNTDPGTAAAGTVGNIVGTVLFEGTPPTRKPLDLIEGSQGCKHHQETPLSEDVVVNDGKLANVFVYLKSIPAGVTIPPPPTEPFVLNQVGCMYVPHVAGIQAGRPLQAGNDDDTAHNVRCGGIKYVGANLTIGAGSAPLALPTPGDEEVAINFNCDIHPWMNAKVCVVEHPWFCVSAEDGTFTIGDVPPGTYKIEAWQEKYGKARCSGEVVVGNGGSVTVDFTYKP